MPKLSYKGLKERGSWKAAGIKLPVYDPEVVAERTVKDPVWIHFSAGNLFRAYIAALQDKLLNEGFAEYGIVVAETFDPEIIERVLRPHDNLCIVVTLKPESGAAAVGNSGDVAGGGAAYNSGVVIGSISGAYSAADATGYEKLHQAFINPSLQMVSMTVTEKAYSLRGADGEYMTDVTADIKNGPDRELSNGLSDGPVRPINIMAVIVALLYERYKSGAYPITLVSMDNCSKNGERLRSAVLEIAGLWAERGFCERDFIGWLGDESRVSFPWSMIDKITPWPSESIAKRLADAGISDMSPIITHKGTVVAPFVNTEPAQYLVIEDTFPNGRPLLENAGVIFADRETVNRAERMKVATCLNPLHTSLAIFGFLLGFNSIAEAVKDADLLALIRRIAYTEGLPAVENPGVIDPMAFVDEVINERLPNPMIPDTPQRIATDSSQKIPIRFGGTIRFYMDRQAEVAMLQKIAKPADLVGIPLVIAGWLRYLLAVDDNLKPYTPSPDPMLEIMREKLSGIKTGCNDVAYIKETLEPILTDTTLFGADLRAAGLADKITGLFIDMIAGASAVRKTLAKHLR